MDIKSYKYGETGLNRFFGPLEAKIMDYLWDAGELSIKQMQERLDREKALSFNTVMTVMNRLVDKGILRKRAEGRLSLFRPVQTREEFIGEQSRKLTRNLLDEFGGVVITHMIDALDHADEKLLAQLEDKIQKLKKDSP